jgi:hypothetical protein
VTLEAETLLKTRIAAATYPLFFHPAAGIC